MSRRGNRVLKESHLHSDHARYIHVVCSNLFFFLILRRNCSLTNVLYCHFRFLFRWKTSIFEALEAPATHPRRNLIDISLYSIRLHSLFIYLFVSITATDYPSIKFRRKGKNPKIYIIYDRLSIDIPINERKTSA